MLVEDEVFRIKVDKGSRVLVFDGIGEVANCFFVFYVDSLRERGFFAGDPAVKCEGEHFDNWCWLSYLISLRRSVFSDV
jgi:hypothetical protein